MADDPAGANSPAERLASEVSQKGDDRDSFQRDRDILLYTSAFKRLSGITQVISSHTGHVFHNRLTHSLQVAQVGRSLAEKLQIRQKTLAKRIQLEPHAVEAACLAHDLGHPPFGHVAEEKLNDEVGEESEAFEGNAQSFRIVTELAFRSANFSGLNLTRATLRGILKYPWTFANRPKGPTGELKKKWGAYTSASRYFEFATGNKGGGPAKKSVEAQLMDWSDDLTYAIHDAEDFYRAGMIPLHLLNRPGQIESQRFLNYVHARRDQIPELQALQPNEIEKILVELLLPHFTILGPYEGTRDDRARLRIFTSRLVGRYINGLTLTEASDGGVGVTIEDEFIIEIAILKQLTWFYVIEAPSLLLQQHAQTRMIEFLFNVFMQEVGKSRSRLLPPYYRERLGEIPKETSQRNRSAKRLVADLIAGMTEGQAIAVYQRLNGFVLGSAFEKILV